MRYFIELQYRGSAYHGWQKQNNALGVQQVLEEALSKLLRTDVEVTGSSRTDTGVHAEQQFAHFDVPAPIENIQLSLYKFNALVPRDISIRRLIHVPDDTHSRFAATHRKYEYRIIREKNPFLEGLAIQVRGELNVAEMNKAATLLRLHSDFESFSKIHTNVNNFHCRISEAHWVENGNSLVFHVKANRFLRGMVRALVGTMLEVGRGKTTISDFENIILAKNRKMAAAQAPPEGLFLVEVGYPETLFKTFSE